MLIIYKLLQKKTMERLLRKQESKSGKMSSKGRTIKRQVPSVTLCYSLQGISITLPPDTAFPLTPVRLVPQFLKIFVLKGEEN